ERLADMKARVMRLLERDHTVAAPRQQRRGGAARGAAADHHHVAGLRAHRALSAIRNGLHTSKVALVATGRAPRAAAGAWTRRTCAMVSASCARLSSRYR